MVLREDEVEKLKTLLNKYKFNEEVREMLILFCRKLGDRTLYGNSNYDHAFELGKRCAIDELLLNLK